MKCKMATVIPSMFVAKVVRSNSLFKAVRVSYQNMVLDKRINVVCTRVFSSLKIQAITCIIANFASEVKGTSVAVIWLH